MLRADCTPFNLRPRTNERTRERYGERAREREREREREEGDGRKLERIEGDLFIYVTCCTGTKTSFNVIWLFVSLKKRMREKEREREREKHRERDR